MVNIILVTVSTALLIDTGARRKVGAGKLHQRGRGREVPSERPGQESSIRQGRGEGQSAEDRSARAEQAKWGREGEVPKC